MRPDGLVVWFSLWVREVPGSIPGQAQIFIIFLNSSFYFHIDLKDRIFNIPFRLDEDCLCENRFLKEMENKLNIEMNHEFGMISLHSCGDLTPNMLKLFLNESRIKFLAAFSCCYHSMKYNEDGMIRVWNE